MYMRNSSLVCDSESMLANAAARAVSCCMAALGRVGGGSGGVAASGALRTGELLPDLAMEDCMVSGGDWAA